MRRYQDIIDERTSGESDRLDAIEAKLDLLIKMMDLQMSTKDIEILDQLTNEGDENVRV